MDSISFHRNDCISLISGADKIKILDRSVSTSLLALDNNQFIKALFCNTAGRIDDVALICPIDDKILMISSDAFCSETRSKLLEGIGWDEEFELRDAVAAISRFTVILSQSKAFSIFGINEIKNNIMEEYGDMIILSTKIGESVMLDILCQKGSIDTLLALFERSDIKLIDEQKWNLTRVKLGIIDIEDARGNLPWEIGLDKLISSGKGCYPGQEIHARMDSRGNKNKTLVRVISDKKIEVGKLRVDGFGTINVTSSYSENELCYSLGICKDMLRRNIELTMDGSALTIESIPIF
tara:strand:+ start:45 stop:929 length:885 start_codon:yes stop_codon:yes gene_type:complete